MRRLRDPDPGERAAARRIVAEAYWSAIYKHLRLRFKMEPEAAEDTVQGFFVRLLESDMLGDYDPARGTFRTYLRRCVDHYAVDEHRRASAKRRAAPGLVLDFALAENQLVADAVDDTTDVFDREWRRRFIELAVARLFDRLEQRRKPVHAELFRLLYLQDEPPTYQAAADALGIKLTDATNWLHTARREFRRVALELLRELTANDAEFAEEARAVFGIDVGDASDL